MDQLAQRLASSRALRGLKQSELAERAGLSVRMVGSYEQGESKPSLESFWKLAQALDIDVYYLWGLTPTQLPFMEK